MKSTTRSEWIFNANNDSIVEATAPKFLNG
jgi:hypothetical protein